MKKGFDTRNASVELTNELGNRVQCALIPAVHYLFAQTDGEAKNGEAVIATIGGTFAAAMSLVRRFDFPTAEDCESFRQHLHTILDEQFTQVMRAKTAGEA